MSAEGNAAKLYCLKHIEKLIAAAPSQVRILDLGCGDAGLFVDLLRAYPTVQYVGVEPSLKAARAARRNLEGLGADVLHMPGYALEGKVADIVVSFSVLEHVYNRRRYLECAKRNLAPHGHFFINYDAGHFRRDAGLRDRMKTAVGPVLAALGWERYYQSFVSEDSFRSLIASIGFEPVDVKFFNSCLKSIYRHVPDTGRREIARQWLELELALNDSGLRYTDALADLFSTRNYILRHASASTTTVAFGPARTV